MTQSQRSMNWKIFWAVITLIVFLYLIVFFSLNRTPEKSALIRLNRTFDLGTSQRAFNCGDEIIQKTDLNSWRNVYCVNIKGEIINLKNDTNDTK